MLTGNSPLSWIASPHDRSVLRLPGTNRARPPAATLELARRAAVRVQVTRVADITRLDTIGIPTYQAIRPMAKTLAVSQGKGMTPELAKVSAMMEAIEIWHVEQPMPPVATASPREVSGELSYPVGDLALAEPSLLHDRLPLDWVVARSLLDGAETLVPATVVRLSLERKVDWNPPVFFESTNGLASGNTLVEATLHALYEVVERDAMTAAVNGGGMGVPVDPRTLRSPLVDELCAMIRAADVRLWVRFVPSPTNLPCFLAWVACDDYPVAMFGFGCHLSPVIALTRAITEAVQTRVAYISGARDDLREDIYGAGQSRWLTESASTADIREVMAAPEEHESLLGDLEYAVKQATAAFGHPPLVVDLTREDIGVPVVKVVAPGSRVCSKVL